MPNLDLTINEDDPNQAGLLSASFNFGELVPAAVAEFVRGDVEVYCAVKTVRETADGGYEYSHESGDTYIVAIGNPDTPSTGGEANFDIDGTAANSIAYDATAAAFQTIFSAASVTAGFGAVVVTKMEDGVYQIDWQTDGEVPDGAITGDESELIPASQIVISPISVGSVSSKAQYVIQWKQAPVAQAAPTTEFPAASVTIGTTQAATANRNKIENVSFSDGIMGGTFAVALTVLGTSESVGVSWPGMSAEDFGALLANHSLVNYRNTDGTADNIIVSKSQQVFYVEFIGTLAGSTLRKTINDATVANPTELTTSANHNYLDGDTVTISNSSGITPSLNGSYTITVTDVNKFTIPVNVTAASGESARAFNDTQPHIEVTDIDLINVAGVYGTIGLNTINLAKSFLALDASVQNQAFKLSVKRFRLSGEERTLLLINVNIKRSLIDLGAIVDMPSLLAFLMQYATLSVSSAGTSEVTVPTNARYYTLRVTVGAGGGAYSRNIDLSSASRASGDKCQIVLVMPASSNPTIVIRENTGSVTLYTEYSTGVAYVRNLFFSWNGTAWESDQGAS